MRLDFKEFFKSFNKKSCSQILSKTPEKFFDDYGYPEYKFLIGVNYQETQKNLYRYVYGEQKCLVCSSVIEKFWNWNHGWSKTCSEKCENLSYSIRQQGSKNTSHRMTKQTKNRMRQKMSVIMKNKILNGEFTPKTCNYSSQRPIHFIKDGHDTFVRSLWELIYWLRFPHLEYETVRLEYYDSVKKRTRIYITDFYDRQTNTIIEIRPKKYQMFLVDKEKSVVSSGYNYKIVDEDYFNTQKTEEMLMMIENAVVNIDDVQSRLKWLKKV